MRDIPGDTCASWTSTRRKFGEGRNWVISSNSEPKEMLLAFKEQMQTCLCILKVPSSSQLSTHRDGVLPRIPTKGSFGLSTSPHVEEVDNLFWGFVCLLWSRFLEITASSVTGLHSFCQPRCSIASSDTELICRSRHPFPQAQSGTASGLSGSASCACHFPHEHKLLCSLVTFMAPLPRQVGRMVLIKFAVPSCQHFLEQIKI